MPEPSRGEPIASTPSFRIMSCADGLGIAEVGPVCLVLWREAVTEPRFARQRQALQDVVARNPGKAGLVCVVEATVAPPDERLRAASTAMIRGHGDRLRWVACVIEGSGFRAAVTRSVLSGMALLVSRRGLDLTFAASLADVTPWVASRSDSYVLQLNVACEALSRGLSLAPSASSVTLGRLPDG